MKNWQLAVKQADQGTAHPSEHLHPSKLKYRGQMLSHSLRCAVDREAEAAPSGAPLMALDSGRPAGVWRVPLNLTDGHSRLLNALQHVLRTSVFSILLWLMYGTYEVQVQRMLLEIDSRWRWHQQLILYRFQQ